MLKLFLKNIVGLAMEEKNRLTRMLQQNTSLDYMDKKQYKLPNITY